ncbi:MAG: hydrogenase nickel incorporation protein HypB [Nocardioidaceae bacterium]
MCSTCGCSDDSGTRVTALSTVVSAPPARRHEHDHHHHHDQDPTTQTVVLEQDIMAKNNRAAAHNRGWLDDRGIVALNLMSSPGAGKTTLLARTIADLKSSHGSRPIAVVEGDQETLLDAERIRATGVPVVQINTGAGCHLDADMVQRGLASLDPPSASLLFIENVGNLVCPALFDLGETARVVVMSVTEGEDKPLKYPNMFAAADLVVINKADLLPYVDFDIGRCMAYARRIKPGLPYLTVSATAGDGLEMWYAWLAGLTARA